MNEKCNAICRRQIIDDQSRFTKDYLTHIYLFHLHVRNFQDKKFCPRSRDAKGLISRFTCVNLKSFLGPDDLLARLEPRLYVLLQANGADLDSMLLPMAFLAPRHYVANEESLQRHPMVISQCDEIPHSAAPGVLVSHERDSSG
jgi:hypothetical protein